MDRLIIRHRLQNYLGYGGTHSVPDGAYEATGIWRRTMNLTAGEQAVFAIHCNCMDVGTGTLDTISSS